MPNVQIVRYRCCGVVFAACAEPFCYTDKKWKKDVRDYLKQGHKTEIVPSSNFITVNNCKCKSQPQPTQGELF